MLSVLLVTVVLATAAFIGPAHAEKESCASQRSKADQLFVDPPKNSREAMSASYMHFSLMAAKEGRKTILMWGGVCGGDGEQVRKALNAAAPIGEVWFYSPGGALEEGLQIGRIIRKSGVRTRVPANFECVSACNFMFMGGVIRYIEPGGEFGVHMFANSGISQNDTEMLDDINHADDLAKSYNDRHPGKSVTSDDVIFEALMEHNKKIQQDSAQISAEIARFLVEMQLSLRFLTEFANIPNEKYRVLRRDELRDFNIINTD